MEGFTLDAAAVAAAIGYIATMLIDIIKPVICSRIDNMRDGELARQVKDPVLKFLALFVTTLCAVVISYVAVRFGFLPEDGIIATILLSFPGAGAWFQVESRRKSKKVEAQASLMRPPN